MDESEITDKLYKLSQYFRKEGENANGSHYEDVFEQAAEELDDLIEEIAEAQAADY